MKNYLIGLLIVFFSTSCTPKKEEEKPVEKPEVKHIDVTSEIVGENKEGEFVIRLDDSIAKHLVGRLKESFALSENVAFSEFKIVKAVTKGEGVKDSYMLTTLSSDKLLLIGVMLNLTDDKFYFRVNGEKRTLSTEVIMCKKTVADSDCHPVVLFYNGSERLICESSGGCEKTGGEVWW